MTALWSRPHSSIAENNGKEGTQEMELVPGAEWIPAVAMFVPTEYQRPVVRAIVNKIISGLDDKLFGVLTLSEREPGMFAVLDGQQRLTGVRELGLGDRRLPAVVHRGLSVEEEARIFWQMNSSARRGLTAEEVFRGRLVGNDPAALDIRRIAREAGYYLALDGHYKEGPNVIRAVGALNTIYETSLEFGPKDLEATLGLVRDAWGDDPKALQSTLLNGISRFHRMHRSHGYDRARLVSVLESYAPSRVVEDGNEEARIGSIGSAAGIARNLTRKYNNKLHAKNRLPGE